jgi:hypothetical protein
VGGLNDIVAAATCRCCLCKKPAVGFWPVLDLDIPYYPYCQACLDMVRFKLLAKLQRLNFL